ncbi:MAG TPA: hypothetical protein GX742_01340 [Acholeplasmataceae bacterium]|nr:hypothetical protein [Acholeplasmataceae bacterium]
MSDNNDFKPYKSNRISNWPTSLKVFILKTWTAGMVFYFIFMSLEIFSALRAHEDRWLIVIMVIIILNEYLINNLIKSMEQDKTILNKHAMFINDKWSMIYNIGYIFLVVIITILLGGLIIGSGISLSKITMPQEAATWEPFTFGLLYYLIDTSLIFIVNLIKQVFNKKGEK